MNSVWKSVTESVHLQDEQITYLNHTIVKMAKVQLAVEHLSIVVNSLDHSSKNITLALLFSHQLHLLELAFHGILDEWGNFLKMQFMKSGKGD